MSCFSGSLRTSFTRTIRDSRGLGQGKSNLTSFTTVFNIPFICRFGTFRANTSFYRIKWMSLSRNVHTRNLVLVKTTNSQWKTLRGNSAHFWLYTKKIQAIYFAISLEARLKMITTMLNCTSLESTTGTSYTSGWDASSQANESLWFREWDWRERWSKTENYKNYDLATPQIATCYTKDSSSAERSSWSKDSVNLSYSVSSQRKRKHRFEIAAMNECLSARTSTYLINSTFYSQSFLFQNFWIDLKGFWGFGVLLFL